MRHTAVSRRRFLQYSAGATAATWTGLQARTATAATRNAGDNMAFGLVTYMWGADWDLPTLLENCQKTKVLGVELRTTHAHKVEPDLSEDARNEVRKRFASSGVTLVGIGSNERYDNPNPEVVRKAIEATKDFIRLSHDIGGTGVKVKPDSFHKDVPREKTIEQIGKALNELGEYGSGFGQQIRLEVHGQCAELPTIKAIMDVATNENVAVCWNSNPTDLLGEGLEHNFKLVRKRFGDTCHIHELNDSKYPFAQLIELLEKSDYNGWLLLEAGSKPTDRIAALIEQRQLFEKMVKAAQGAK
jgi:sugar phosphate isomerase/epimerase